MWPGQPPPFLYQYVTCKQVLELLMANEKPEAKFLNSPTSSSQLFFRGALKAKATRPRKGSRNLFYVETREGGIMKEMVSEKKSLVGSHPFSLP